MEHHRHAAPEPSILMVPGLHNSGPHHWQSLWEADDSRIVRADLGMWDQPRRNVWVTNLGHAIRSLAAPVVVCAHSLGCLAVAWWALLEGEQDEQRVAGALLVAPPDCDRTDLDPKLADFAPTPRVALPFPALLVASRNDPYADISHARQTARIWGATFHDAGELGHINADSGLGRWSDGLALLRRMTDVGRLTALARTPLFTGDGRAAAGLA